MPQFLILARNIFRGLFNLIFPAQCSLCSNPLETIGQKYICPDCLNKIIKIELPICDKCGKPLVSSFNRVQQPLCRECRSMKRHFAFARAVGTYEGVLKKAIWLFKYEGKTGLEAALGSLLVERINYLGWAEPSPARGVTPHSSPTRGDGVGPSPCSSSLRSRGIDIIVPIPLHKTRLKSRGYNQADILARFIGKKLNIPVSGNNLKRIKATITQASLKRKERIKNIHNAFCIGQPEKFLGKGILLIDDVFTTGATSNECSRILKQAGATDVFVLTLARGM